MKALLDTHIILWWLAGSTDKIPPPILDVLKDSTATLFVSAASGWEIATKHRIGKLPLPDGFLEAFPATVQAEGWTALDCGLKHSLHAGRYAMEHRDPFDRMLAAQAELESLSLLSVDEAFEEFPVTRIG